MKSIIALILSVVCMLGCATGTEWEAIPQFDSAIADSGAGTDARYSDAWQVDASYDAIDWDNVCLWCFDAPTSTFEGGPLNTDSGLPRKYVSNDISVAGSVAVKALTGDSGTYGLDMSTIDEIVGNTISSGAVPYDSDGLYYLLTSREIVTYGGCYSFCGYHLSNAITIDGGQQRFRYAMTLDTEQCPGACSMFDSVERTPNQVESADGMVSIIAHELAEAASDPDPYVQLSWVDGFGEEVGDVCAWDPGKNVYETDSGAPYNVKIGDRLFLIQRIWKLDRVRSNHCVIGLNEDPGFDTSIAIPYPHRSRLPNQQDQVLPMEYYGGRVMTNPIHVYWIFYGEWKNRSAVEPVITDFVNGLPTSPWWKAVSKSYFEEEFSSDGGVDAAAEASTDAGAMEAGE